MGSGFSVRTPCVIASHANFLAKQSLRLFVEIATTRQSAGSRDDSTVLYMKKLANLIYEGAAVKRMKRVGFQILGNGEENLGEHSFMTAVISYFLAKKLGANVAKIFGMSIFHDFHEARTGDVHKLATFYVTRNTQKANEDIFKNIDTELLALLEEYEEKKSLEARIVYEANIIALLVELKPLAEKGDKHAEDWLRNKTRLRLPESIALVKELLATDSQAWWEKEQKKLHESFKK